MPNSERLPEIGSILHLEHFNFEGADRDMATIFFMDGLGLTRDPYHRIDETNMGVNIGMQQFHLPRRGATPPFHGQIGLVMPDLAGICIRLNRLTQMGKFDQTSYQLDRLDDLTLRVVSPFGIELKLHAAGSLSFLRQMGLAYVDIPVEPGKAERLQKYYQDFMVTPAVLCELEGEKSLVVTHGPYQYIRYRERKLDDYDLYNFHIAYYVTNYNAYLDRVSELGSILGDGDGRLFFFDELFDPDTGEVILRFQQEVRSIYHPDFMRPLVNRWPLISEPFST